MKAKFAVLLIVLGMMSVSPVLANSVGIDFEALSIDGNVVIIVGVNYSEDGFTLSILGDPPGFAVAGTGTSLSGTTLNGFRANFNFAIGSDRKIVRRHAQERFDPSETAKQFKKVIEGI